MELDVFLQRWSGGEGGAERANYALFLTELTSVLGVPAPDPARADTESNDYVFERAVRPYGLQTAQPKRIDLYKRGCFILEAKQSRQRPDNAKFVVGTQPGLPGLDAPPARTGKQFEDTTARRRKWDVLLRNAYTQALDYVAMLPPEHPAPPFIIVCDVGFCLEIYADFSGTGRGYKSFPDRQNNRIFLEDLRDPKVRELLAAIWTDPKSLDPTARAALATRDIAKRLAEVSKAMEGRGVPAEQAALFLMRCIFTMFAEDVELLPKDSFKALMKRCVEDPSRFRLRLAELWRAMESGGESYVIEATIRRFNGGLFENSTVFDLGREEIGELLEAAERNWREVEPAIFGTLLEQALDTKERAKLGAHFTPRPYVERLVEATIMEPLRAEWDETQRRVEDAMAEGDEARARRIVEAFHHRLCTLVVLDPACGTGNFLYVALDLMKRLEGEVLNLREALSGEEKFRFLTGETVDPHQFIGLELNPRAAAIADLVLWIGHLQLHYRTYTEHPAEPILQAFGNIRKMDAVLTWDGYPVPQVKDGREVLPNPRQPAWPEADFIVGNPPFIGGKDVRANLGDLYAEALWAAHKEMNDSADFVMYWWDRAARLLTAKGSRLVRFGFVTTNSITQVFQRRVIERHLSGSNPLYLHFAIADHPWTKATKDAAAVRIAMTVAARSTGDGTLQTVVAEAGLDTDAPQITVESTRGRINPDLSVGVDVASSCPLRANEGLAYRGVQVIGAGFIVTPAQAEHLGLGRRPGLERHIRPYRNGRDLTARPRGVMVIDLLGLTAEEVRTQFPEVYQHLLATVKPERDSNNRASYRELWWVHGEPRKDLRPALEGLPRYIVTVETTKHRVFQFESGEVLPDNRLVVVAASAPVALGILSSRVHVTWTIHAGGTLEDRPVYTKSRCFDPFPFPDASPEQQAAIGALAEELDATRKAVLAEEADLTLTGLYNLLEAVRGPGGLAALSAEDQDKVARGRVLILDELHRRIDAAVADAYGWPHDLSDQDILARLVALNAERRAEEEAGTVRWLRPDYQIPRFARPSDKTSATQLGLALVGADGAPSAAATGTQTAWPKDRDAQPLVVEMAVRAAAGQPVTAAAIARSFKGGGKRIEPRVAQILLTLASYGRIDRLSNTSYAARRAA